MSAENKSRELSYDILRCISCISVVILHVSSIYVKEDFQDLLNLNEYMIGSFWRVMTNLAVPSFVMLGGAFLIIPQNEDFLFFYKKMIRKIIFPTIIFSFIYVGMYYIEIFVANILNISVGEKSDNYWLPIFNLLRGEPHVAMWYMFMVIGLYLATPVIVMIKGKVSSKSYKIWACVMLVYGMLVNYTCSLSWILGFVSWIGYFLMGDVIREFIKIKKENSKKDMMIAAIAIMISYLILISHWYLFTYKSGTIKIPSSFSPIIVFGTLSQFAGISFLVIKRKHYWISIISKYSLKIYLIHPIFCDVFMQLCGRILKYFPTSMLIPIYSLIIVVMCMMVAWCMTIIKKRFLTEVTMSSS